MTRFIFVTALMACLVGCGDDGKGDPSGTQGDGGRSGAGGNGGAGGSGGAPDPTPLPPLDDAWLTTDKTWKVIHPIASNTKLNPSVPADLEKLLDQGFGETKLGPGQAVVETTLDGLEPPPPGKKPKLLTRFVHLADTQLADDESPARLASLDNPVITAAFRTQEGHQCRILNAAVRTINAINKKTALDFVVLGGDNADNAQANELDWFLAILGGSSRVECDSGKDDDPKAGPDNDPKDAFVAEGLDVPWRWVTGNHDVLNQGNFPALMHNAEAIGTSAIRGARDWSQEGGPVVSGEVPADKRRAEMSRDTMLKKIAADGDGHGISQDVVKYGKAFYTFDAPDSDIRVLVVDTAAETGGADGVIHQKDVDDFVRPALDKALDDGKIVIVTSHHISFALTDGGGFGGTAQKDALTPEEWVDLLGEYDNVIMHLAGHTHVHRVSQGIPAVGHKFWELETAALADYPFQMRVIEIWDQDNGSISIRAIALDYSIDGDAVAKEGHERGIIDLTSGWGDNGAGEPDQRNVNLWIEKPAF